MFNRTLFISLGITLVLAEVLDRFFGYNMPGWASVVGYLLVYALIASFFPTKPKTEAENLSTPEWPISGPIRRFGSRFATFAYTVTGLFSLLNPFQLWQIIQQFVGNTALAWDQRKGGIVAEDHRNRVRYRLPFAGEWIVVNGGHTPATSHSWDVLTQRYAYDFVQADQNRVRHQGEGNEVTDYFCYGEPILAAADGEVVAVADGQRDAPLVGYGIIDFLGRRFVGNHVTVKHADGEYGFYAHLIKGSISVSVGERVTQGQLLGRCGHSGHSTEPHLHFHLQNHPNFYVAMGVPIRFSQIRVDEASVDEAAIVSGNRVQNTTAA